MEENGSHFHMRLASGADYRQETRREGAKGFSHRCELRVDEKGACAVAMGANQRKRRTHALRPQAHMAAFRKGLEIFDCIAAAKSQVGLCCHSAK